MVTRGVVALFVAALVQATCAQDCGCSCSSPVSLGGSISLPSSGASFSVPTSVYGSSISSGLPSSSVSYGSSGSSTSFPSSSVSCGSSGSSISLPSSSVSYGSSGSSTSFPSSSVSYGSSGSSISLPSSSVSYGSAGASISLPSSASFSSGAAYAQPNVRYEEGCCPGEVVEQKVVIQKPVTETYTYSEPAYSRQCYSQPAGVDKQVVPQSYETAPVCETQETVVSVPTTDVEIENTPLCKKVCTTNEYIIQIPIKETTCTSSPLCKQTRRSQDNLLTTVSRKTSCAKQLCTQNVVTETPIVETVCQNYQQNINKVGTKTVLKPEVQKYCYQLPMTKCMKPVVDSDVSYAAAPASYSVPTSVSYGSGAISAATNAVVGPSYIASPSCSC